MGDIKNDIIGSKVINAFAQFADAKKENETPGKDGGT